MSTAATNEFDRDLADTTAPAHWQNPRPDGRYNLVVLGGGPAGLVAAAGAAGLGAKVALIEKQRLGGDCLHYGCVPSKALLRSAKLVGEIGQAEEFGLRIPGPVQVDFPAVMQRLRRLRASIGHHDAAERFRSLGIDVFFGEPCFTGSDCVTVAGQTLMFARALIATGARPAVPTIPGLDKAAYLTNENIFDVQELPSRLLVLGAGPIGCELAQAFRRFGSAVSVIDLLPQILPKDDPAAAAVVRQQLERDGVQLHLGVKPLRAEQHGTDKRLVLDVAGREVSLTGDALLVATGRKANVENLDLERAGIAFSPAGVQVNDFLQTTNPNVYAAGDVCSALKFTHAADAQARLVLRNALFFGRARVSRLVIPWATYTSPEVAHVGLTAAEAEQQGIPVQTFRVDLNTLDRGILDGVTAGFAAVHVRQGKDRIVGATVVAAHAGDLVGEIALAMTAGLGLSALAGTIQPYPTQGEVWKKLGDAYMKTRLTSRAAGVLRTLLRWRR